ncbi:reverse transcriptase-like protein [Elysia marginata]|uniref:Reverse transcriptase-like protein n=1 Tax=Elysia marginata TaxID=1093978 RepID=A0AAV4H1I9_9GAST|nr:reverse transcriptase-like protein [Elysia marginata]
MLSVFFDLSKACDTVWKDGLRPKLLQSNIQGTMYKWNSNFLHNRTARVKLDGKYYSKQVIMKEGVPQGSAISPTLFLVYINNITSAITSYVKHTLHAADFAIWSTAEYATTAKVRVQATVDKVFKWSQDWGLTINLNKTVTTKFSLETKERHVTLTMNGQPLPTEDTPTSLGITLDKRLTWKPHIQKINQKAIRRSQIMKKLSGTKWGANSKILRQVYQGYIRPVMEYASAAWSTAATSNLTSLSKTQNQNLRIVLGAIKSTPIKELHKQAEMDTLENRREQRTLTLYEKSKRNSTHPLHNILREKTKNRLKSRKSPNHVMKKKFEENQDLLWQTDRYEPLKLAESPWDNNKVNRNAVTKRFFDDCTQKLRTFLFKLSRQARISTVIHSIEIK